ncbi:MAG: stage II sporulation protein E [Syntrophomonadaceae bacterium]
MLEKTEVYPYQRVADLGVNKRRAVRRPSLKLKPIKLPGSLLPSLQALFTIDQLLIGAGAVLMARAFVLGELLPFIFAYMAAFGYRSRSRAAVIALFALPGFISVLSGPSLGSNIIAVLLLMGALTTIRIPEDKLWWGLPLLTTAILLVVKTAFLMVTSFSFYGEMVVVFEATIAGIMCFVFMVCTVALKESRPLAHFTFEDIAAFLVLGIGLVMGLQGISLAGLQVSSILCRLGILVAALVWGAGGGTMVGVMTGLIPSMTSSVFGPHLALNAVAGLLAGLFRNFGRLGVMIGFMMGTLALSLFINETQATILGMWESALACLIFFLLPENLTERVPIQSLGPISSLKENEVQVIDTRLKEAARLRIENLARVFDELSCALVKEAPLRSQPTNRGYLDYLYDEIAQGFCKGCSRRETCWEKDCYRTSQEIMEIFTLAEMNGQVQYQQCPEDFRRRCICGRELVSTVNYLFDNLRLNDYWNEKLGESRDLVSRQLQGVSKVIRDLASQIDVQTMVDFALRDRLLSEFKHSGQSIRDITPVKAGDQQKFITINAEACVSGERCEKETAPALSSYLGEKYEVCEKTCPRLRGKGLCEFTMCRSFTYRVTTGAAQVGREAICGDSFTIATLKEGQQLIALSDGMGIGQRALNESQVAVRLLENLLNSGFDRDIALKTINSVLQLKSSAETFATLDMVMIDLFTAEVDFIKVGSVPSFIRRGRRVGVVTSNSLPIGIVENLEIGTERRSLYPGDMLVLVSDGVFEASRSIPGEDWIPEFLTAVSESDPQLNADLIMQKALGLCHGQPRDDMTVICVTLEVNYPH